MNKPIQHLSLQHYLEGESRFYVERFFFRDDMGSQHHDHDFAELFWITRGTCRHTLENREEMLTAGDARFMRPEQVHRLDTVGKAPLHFTNIAFPAQVLDSWQSDYPILNGSFFWTGTSRPGAIRLSEAELADLEQQTHRMAVHTHNLFFLHRFLFNLFFSKLPHPGDDRALPDWLKDGLAALDNPAVRREGSAAFARACSRSPEHVARTCQTLLGASPRELVNEARMTDAALQLRMSDRDILNIMMDCGFSNPSHFYKLFRAKYGSTPREYRLARRSLAGF